MKLKWIIVATGLICGMQASIAGVTELQSPINYKDFLGQHDMVWDRVPNRWEVAPYTGNGNVGFLFYQAKGEAKNVISIYAGRHDYYDHREPHDGHENLWIYRSRLPLGHFKLASKGDIVEADLRLDLWNAEMVGTIKTSEGSYAVRGFSHSLHDVIYFETDASDGESIKVSWHPEVPFAPVRATLDAGGGPKGGTWDNMRSAPYELPPESVQSEEGGLQFCFQPLYKNRGETTTGWEMRGKAAGKQVLLASIHHSFPEHNSKATVKTNLHKAQTMLAADTFFSSHRKWWNDYYPLSFLTINDPEKEAFYWIQMYKFASATRGNGPVMDLMGPWYHKTFWPMVWGDLNVELQYWTHLTANRLDAGASLCNWFDKKEENLYGNVPSHWEDSMGLSTCFPQDLVGGQGGNVPDMLCWILHNYWLHCEFAGDRERMRDGLFPKLKATVNSYRNYLKDNPVVSKDGKIHIKNSWSPEYPGGRGQDINFTIGLMRWSLQTLLDINAEHKLNDPLASEWQDLLDNLVEFQIDEDGLRIGKDIAFEKPHRHYSHLLPFYPLAVLTPETKEDKALMRTTLDHWLDVTFNSGIKVGAMPVTGYTATGAASMYAWLGDSDKAYHYLDSLIQHKNVSTTMYAEGNPVIESPLSFATCIHDMLLQSWGGKVRVFPAAPKVWGDVAFKDFRTQGAFLVSAKKQDGLTEFVTAESLIGSPCIIKTDIPKPKISINGQPAKKSQVRVLDDGFYQVALKQGDRVAFTLLALEDADFDITPIPVSDAEHNLFGLSEKTKRLPGHTKYYPESGASKKNPTTSASKAGLKIYYIRHAEGGHNVKQDWEYRKVPKDQWPAYVGDHNAFTPKGLFQQAAVAEQLKMIDFDFIAASPAWRCQNTILPYMKETGSTGEIWPELHELSASALILSADLSVPTEPILGTGEPIELPPEEASYFSVRADGKNWFKVPHGGTGREARERSNAAARVVIQRVLDMIQDRFGGTDKTILLSGHGSSGQAVLRMLIKDPLDGFTGISNTGIWMVEEQPNGEFKLMMFNSYPLENGRPSAASKHALMDTNGDGQVTKSEYVARHASGFGRKDQNKDGVLSSDEHAHSSFKEADLNQDNQLTREEYAAIFEGQFDHSYDKDGDGVFTVDEMR